MTESDKQKVTKSAPLRKVVSRDIKKIGYRKYFHSSGRPIAIYASTEVLECGHPKKVEASQRHVLQAKSRRCLLCLVDAAKAEGG